MEKHTASLPRYPGTWNHRHLQTDGRSVAAASNEPVAFPYISLKAKMLGGHAETVMRRRGSER